jgi:hypothetical protein
MAHTSELTQPSTLIHGGNYLLLERREGGRKQVLTPVKFTAYDPCPAFVIVATEIGNKQRCPRDALYTESGRRRA